MKIAVGIIALFLGLIVLMQSCTIATTAGLTDNTAIHQAGSMGVLVGLMVFMSGAFAFGLPQVSTIMLVLAGLLSLMVAKDFPDMRIWGFIAFALAAMAGFAWRSIRQAKRERITPTEAKAAAPSQTERMEPTVTVPVDRDGGAA